MCTQKTDSQFCLKDIINVELSASYFKIQYQHHWYRETAEVNRFIEYVFKRDSYIEKSDKIYVVEKNEVTFVWFLLSL